MSIKRQPDDLPVMYVPRMDAFLNVSFKDYDAARSTLDRDGGYLLPYRGKYFIAAADSIRELGLDPQDPDWERIGWDWVQPADDEAWARLALKRTIAS